jgi:capsular polysaccharide biosynthesis protein
VLHADPDDLRERLWAYEDFSPDQEHPGFDVTGAFASLGFLRAALKRSARVWLGTALIGLVIGAGLYASLPPKYQATTSIFFTHNQNEDPLSQAETDQALLATRPIAAKVIQDLGVQETLTSFLSSYSSVIVTNQVLSITASGPTSTQAVSRVQDIAAVFLAFRANMLRTQLQQEVVTLGQEVTAAQQKVDSLNQQINQLTSSGTGDQAQLTNLRKQRTDAVNTLSNLQATVANSDASQEVITSAMINGTEVINPAAALPHSKFKYLAFYIAAALFGGLALGMAFVVIRALVSDRLRRRGDVATALGVPVRLSTGWGGTGWGRRAPAGTRVVRYLRSAVPSGTAAPATLAVVAVDNTRDVAGLVAGLARTCASEGLRVAVADLTPGAPAARQLGSHETGVHQVPVSSPGAPVSPLLTVIPEREDIAPDGPLRRDSPSPLHLPADPALAAACGSADLLITLLTLDPATGADHLRTWATDVVVVVTAGRSSGQRLFAVGELIRLARPQSVSAVLVNADRTDQSLGSPETPGQPSLTMPG